MGAAAAILVAALALATGDKSPANGAGGPCVPLRNVAPGWQSGEPDGPDAHVRVTHSYPRWPWPALYEGSRPAFLVRLNRVVEPWQIAGLLQISSDDRGWRKPQWELLHCFTEGRGSKGHTTVV